jgi:hypothetical protein
MTAMHLIVPFALPLSDACRQALPSLALPQLQALLAGMDLRASDAGDELSLSTPHERALAVAMGWGPCADGLVPLAQALAQRQGLASAAQPGWGLLTPAHWRLGTEQISLMDPEALNLDDADSRAFLAVVSELFTSEGFEMHFAGPTAWLCRHDVLADLPTASLDRVVGRNVDRWLEADPRARLLRRLQNEVQMLLHEHPLNEAREAAGELPLNSVWLSGTGVLAQGARVDIGADGREALVLDDRLRSPALGEDLSRWAAGWRTLDEDAIGPLLARQTAGEPVRLTLCGERGSHTWQSTEGGWMRRLTRRWRSASLVDRLEGL